jgi:acetyl esterase/lipase/lysophospholipase L1-like esterase
MIKRPSLHFFQALLIAGLSITLVSQTVTAKPAAVTPVSRLDQDWWKDRHAEKLAEAKARADEIELLFIGDSITHGWDTGVWAENFGKYGALNLGYGGDRTEHVLWRFEHGELDGLSPKATVLMIGTNNTGQAEGQPANETIQGIEAIIDQIKQRLPNTHLIVHAVFPRGATADDPLRLVNDQINAALPALTKAKGVEFLDINNLFLEEDGTLPRNIMPDLLHPKNAGYKLWAYGLKPSLDRAFGVKERKPKTEVISLWPTGVPAPHEKGLVETVEVGPKKSGGVVTRVSYVAEPSMKVYLPNGRRARAAVLVCPGGGYNILAWDLEGEEIAEWLNSNGIVAAVLKYRVPRNREGALQDAQRALGMIRSKTEEWNLIPDQIGVMGFSAGGHLSATLSNHWRKRGYPAVDGADKLSCRPDFTILIYPAYIGDENFEMVSDFQMDSNPPPAFIVQTQDDKKYFPSAVTYHTALVKAGVESELHAFPTGGHGYGLRPSAYPVSGWKDLARDWLMRR